MNGNEKTPKEVAVIKASDFLITFCGTSKDPSIMLPQMAEIVEAERDRDTETLCSMINEVIEYAKTLCKDLDFQGLSKEQKRLLLTPTRLADISIRARNALVAGNERREIKPCEYLYQAAGLKKTDILKLRNVGFKTFNEIVSLFEDAGLEIGKDYSHTITMEGEE